jgi:hypothetical protein
MRFRQSAMYSSTLYISLSLSLSLTHTHTHTHTATQTHTLYSLHIFPSRTFPLLFVILFVILSYFFVILSYLYVFQTEFVALYETYTTAKPLSRSTLATLRKRNREFHEFLRLRENPNSLESMLILPIQRITRYALLLHVPPTASNSQSFLFFFFLWFVCLFVCLLILSV